MVAKKAHSSKCQLYKLTVTINFNVEKQLWLYDYLVFSLKNLKKSSKSYAKISLSDSNWSNCQRQKSKLSTQTFKRTENLIVLSNKWDLIIKYAAKLKTYTENIETKIDHQYKQQRVTRGKNFFLHWISPTAVKTNIQSSDMVNSKFIQPIKLFIANIYLMIYKSMVYRVSRQYSQNKPCTSH